MSAPMGPCPHDVTYVRQAYPVVYDSHDYVLACDDCDEALRAATEDEISDAAALYAEKRAGLAAQG